MLEQDAFGVSLLHSADLSSQQRLQRHPVPTNRLR